MKIKHHKRLSKRAALAAVLIFFLMGIGAYVWLSVNAWQSFESRLKSERTEYERLQEQALKGNTTTERQRAIRQLDDKLRGRERLCDISPVFLWQSALVPVLQDGMKRCNDKKQELDRYAVPVRALRQYVDTAESVRAAILNLGSDETFKEGNWDKAGVEAADSVKAALERLNTYGNEQAAELKRVAISTTADITKAWDALQAAHSNKDKAAYLKASAEVIEAYGLLAKLADMADDEIKQAATELTELTRTE